MFPIPLVALFGKEGGYQQACPDTDEQAGHKEHGGFGQKGESHAQAKQRAASYDPGRLVDFLGFHELMV